MSRRITRGRRLVALPAVAALTLGLMACGNDSDSPAGENSTPGDTDTGGDDVTTVTVWAWYPEFEQVVEHFNDTHDDIQIDYVNAGVSSDTYAVLRTTLEAGTGAPDVTQMEVSELPSFMVMGGLLDIGEHVPDGLADAYPDWVWSQVTQGDSVYAVPVDGGPLVTFYRTDLYEEHGLEPAGTWEEYRENAETLKASDPSLYISSFQIGNASNLVGLIQQAGGNPYGYSLENPDQVTIDFDNELTRQVLNYWGELIEEDLVDGVAYHSTEWDTGIASGTYLTTIEAAWRPGYLGNVAESTHGDWGVAPMPQWDAGESRGGNHGGSAFAVTSQAQDPEAAAFVAAELFGSDEAWEIGIEEAFLFPLYNPVAQTEDFLERPFDFFGGQAANEVFVQAAQDVTPMEFSPFDSFAKSTINEQIADAIAGNQTMDEAAAEIQRLLAEYAESVGLTVNES